MLTIITESIVVMSRVQVGNGTLAVYWEFENKISLKSHSMGVTLWSELTFSKKTRLLITFVNKIKYLCKNSMINIFFQSILYIYIYRTIGF